MTRHLMFSIAVALAAATIPAGAAVDTIVAMPDPSSHQFEISVRLDGVTGATVRFAFPGWTPGNYRMDEIAGGVVALEASGDGGRALAARKVDIRTWEVDRDRSTSVKVSYRYYADERGSPYDARLNAALAHANLVRILGYFPGHEHDAQRILVVPPAGWTVATSLEPAGPGLTRVFKAPDYDTLADGIVFAGPELYEITFDEAGARFRLVFSEKPSLKDRAVEKDTRAYIREIAAVFGEVPFKEYLFAYIVEPESGHGGLEHLCGTSIAFPRTTFEDRETYLRFLGTSAHELVHAWNVKRLRPQGIGPFDFTKPAPTSLIFVSEGFTSYFGTLSEIRGGSITRDEFYKSAADTLRIDRDNVGARFKSLERFSWDWWVEGKVPYYSVRTVYSRGGLVALALDLEIRHATGGTRSLDDVMRSLYRTVAPRATGFTDKELRESLVREGAPGMDTLLDRLARAPGRIDFGPFLARAGLEVVPDPAAPAVPLLGARTSGDGGALPKVDWVEPDSPAAKAGLQSGDELLALSGTRLRADRLDKTLVAAGANATAEIAYFRDGRLRSAKVALGDAVPPKLIVRPRADATDAQKALLDGWLAPRAAR